MPDRVLSFTEAICEATRDMLSIDAVHVIGLGVDYKNGADGTTAGLAEQFPLKVHDVPCSEAAVTGMAVGAAAMGLRPIVHHGRVEFAMFAADAILTQAAKWNYMFGGDYPIPAVFRVAVGRQWGNGPQHTHVPRGTFAIPGLKVVVPSTPLMAAGLLRAAVMDPNPVIFLEHRWLYKLKQTVPGGYIAPMNQARVLREGDAITVVALADMVLETLRAAKLLAEVGISIEVIDLVSINPIDFETIRKSVRKTGRLIVADVSTPEFSVGRSIGAVLHNLDSYICSQAPATYVECASHPCPTAPSLTTQYYPNANSIIATVYAQLSKSTKPDMSRFQERTFEQIHLPPTDNIDDLCPLPV